mgnify:CR=1 FL=1
MKKFYVLYLVETDGTIQECHEVVVGHNFKWAVTEFDNLIGNDATILSCSLVPDKIKMLDNDKIYTYYDALNKQANELQEEFLA